MASTKPIPTPESKSVSKTAIIVTTITNPFSQSVLNNFIMLLIFTNLNPITIKIAAKEDRGINSSKDGNKNTLPNKNIP